MRLADCVGDRNNNFNLLRMLAASAVLFSHCFALTSGSGDAEPLRKWLGMTPGTIAVDVFFVASGFLVTASLLSGIGLRDFARARALRIYPAMLVATLLTLSAVAMWFAQGPVRELLAQPGTRLFLLKNTTLLFGAKTTLHGVFETAPFAEAVNGSLWTLPYELRLYVLLALLWWIVRRRLATLRVVLPILAVACLMGHLWLGSQASPHSLRFAALFLSGGALFLWRDRVTLNAGLFALATGALLLAAWLRDPFFLVYHLVLPWLVVCLAYAPSGPLRAYNRLGDYSYGLYIYAFPVQQSYVVSLPGVNAWELLLPSLATTLALSVLSWHLIEKPALRLKHRRAAMQM